MNRFIYVFFSSVLVSIAACSSGGGGGDSSDENSEPVAITQDNGREIAATGMSASEIVNDQRDSTDLLQSGNGSNSATASVNSLWAKSGKLIGKASQSQTLDCESGTMTLAATDANNNQELDAGDSFSIEFDDCVLTEGTSTSRGNGKVTMKINSFSEDGKNVNVTATYDDLTVVEDGKSNSIDGSMTMDVATNGDTVTATVSGKKMVFTEDKDTGTLADFTFRSTINELTQAWTNSIDATVSSSEIKGKIEITTPLELQGVGENNPTIGEVKMEGANSTFVSLNADTGNIDTLILTIFDGSVTKSDEIRWDELD